MYKNNQSNLYIKYTAKRRDKNTKLVYLIFGTRPEVIKLYPIIQELKKEKKYFSSTVICTYQQEEMVKQILNDFQIEPDISLQVMEKRQPLSFLSSKLFLQLEMLFSNEKPDITIVQGDTTTALVGALCSFYHKVPVAHIEAGLRTRKLYFPFPEELNRQIISDIAKYNFCPTKLSAENLLYEMKDNSTIYVVGNTVIDTLLNSYDMINKSDSVKNIKKIVKGIYHDKSNKFIILLTIHRRENYGFAFTSIIKAIYHIIKKYNNIYVIYPIHFNPNVMFYLSKTVPDFVLDKLINNKKIDNYNYTHLNRFIIVKPLSYFSLIYLLNQSYFVMTDSGGIQEESVALQKPILILRNTTERMEGVLSKSAILVGTNYNNVLYYSEKLINDKSYYESMKKSRNIYGNGNSAKQIISVLKQQ